VIVHFCKFFIFTTRVNVSLYKFWLFLKLFEYNSKLRICVFCATKHFLNKELFLSKVKIINNEQTSDIKSQLKKESLGLIKNLYSIIDKAVKKGVIHKNTAARKKSRFGKISANV
jgi:ribosomal protein S20